MSPLAIDRVSIASRQSVRVGPSQSSADRGAGRACRPRERRLFDRGVLIASALAARSKKYLHGGGRRRVGKVEFKRWLHALESAMQQNSCRIIAIGRPAMVRIMYCSRYSSRLVYMSVYSAAWLWSRIILSLFHIVFTHL